MWHAITTPDEAAAFLALVGDFHDGCLREAHLWTEHSVADDLSMGIGLGWDTRVRLLVQRQFRPLSAVELYFQGVRRFQLAASPPDYESIIFAATLTVAEEGVFWADRSGWSYEDTNRDEATWIWAGQLHWRDASEWMGAQLRYGAGSPGLPAV
jgi:hypothetical protein